MDTESIKHNADILTKKNLPLVLKVVDEIYDALQLSND